MKLLQNLKKDKKGFTLIEMIVVIVIIGILLAILVPGMFRYIDRAKEKQVEVDARTAYLETQIQLADQYALTKPDYAQVKVETVNKATGLSGKISATYNSTNGEIISFEYGDPNSKKKATYSTTDKTWTISEGDVTNGIKASNP